MIYFIKGSKYGENLPKEVDYQFDNNDIKELRVSYNYDQERILYSRLLRKKGYRVKDMYWKEDRFSIRVCDTRKAKRLRKGRKRILIGFPLFFECKIARQEHKELKDNYKYFLNKMINNVNPERQIKIDKAEDIEMYDWTRAKLKRRGFEVYEFEEYYLIEW